MDISTIKKTIVLEPKYLNASINDHIFFELKRKYDRSCCEEYGLIIDIVSIVSYDNVINKDSTSISFMITFLAHTIKPEIGMILSFIPSLIVQKGIFGKIYDNINIFVPENSLKKLDYQFNESKNSYENDNHIITNQTEISVAIEQYKYDMIKYNCISQLV